MDLTDGHAACALAPCHIRGEHFGVESRCLGKTQPVAIGGNTFWATSLQLAALQKPPPSRVPPCRWLGQAEHLGQSSKLRISARQLHTLTSRLRQEHAVKGIGVHGRQF